MAEPKPPRRNGGILTKAEKQQFLETVAAGIMPTDAAGVIGRTYATIINTIDLDPEFAAAVEKTKTEMIVGCCEKTMLELADGKTCIRKWKYGQKWVNGELIRDADGNPVMELKSTLVQELPPDKGANDILLRAHCPKYGEKAQTTATMGDESSPEALAADLLAKYPENPAEPADDTKPE